LTIFVITNNTTLNRKEGLINNAFEEEAEIKGRCRVIAVILNIEYEDLFEAR